jgi:hypothetical protein
MVETETAAGSDSQKRGVVGSLTKKLLAPVVATAASALARYAAKNAPRILEQTVLPKLREVRRSTDGRVQDLPAKARAAASGAGELAQELAGRVSGGEDGPPAPVPSSKARTTLSRGELAERREARAERRTARRDKTSTS